MGRGLARNGEAQWTGRSVSAETLTGVFWHARRVHGEQRRAGGDCGELSQLEQNVLLVGSSLRPFVRSGERRLSPRPRVRVLSQSESTDLYT